MPAPKSRPPESLMSAAWQPITEPLFKCAHSAGLTGTPACVRPVPLGAASAALQCGLAGCGQLRLFFFAPTDCCSLLGCNIGELPGYTTLSSLALGQLRKLVLFLHGEHRNVCYSLLYSRHAGYRICSISQAASKGCTPLSRIWIAFVCVRRVATSPLIRHVNIIMVLVRWPSSTLSSARTPRGLGDVELRELLGLPPGEELPPAGVPLDALHLVYCDR